MRRKANGGLGVVAIIRDMPPRSPGRTCNTCSVEGWAGVVREALDAMISGGISIDTSCVRILEALRDHHEKLGVERYPYSKSAMMNHITGCERERWEKIQSIRHRQRSR